MSANSVIFDGVDEYMTVGDVTPLQFERTDAFSISCWVKFRGDISGNPYLISKMQSAGDFRGYAIQVLGGSSFRGRLRFRLVNTTSNWIHVDSVPAIDDGRWHHVVVTYDGSSTAAGVVIYIDGAQVLTGATADALSATISNAVSFQVSGRDGTNQPFSGIVDDVAVYDKELTSGEVTTIYGAGDPPDLTSVGPTGNLVGLWEMGDGASFPTIPDASTNSNDGTLTNMESGDIVTDVPTTTGAVTLPSASSVDFGGTDEYALIGDVTELQFERTDSFSISAWFKRSGSPSESNVLFGKQAGSTTFRGYILFMETTTGTIRFDLVSDAGGGDTIGIRTSAGFNDGEWHHVVATYDGSSTVAGINLYIDGAAVSTATVASGPLTATILTTEGAIIGARTSSSPQRFFVGGLDEVAVYDVELTQYEASSLFNGRYPPDLLRQGPVPHLVGWWRMGDGDTFSTLTDSSPSGNDATMTNMESGDIVSDTPVLTSAEASTGVSAVQYFQMRAVADPGPGYLTWVVTGAPDPTGVEAPGAIVGGSAVVLTSWTE